jgi:hypothetical protein
LGLKIYYLPSVFTIDLFENRDVWNGRKEQNTGTELDGININSTPGHFYISLLSVRKECKNVLLLKLSLINWNTVNVNSNFSCENCLLFQIIALSLQSRVPSVLKWRHTLQRFSWKSVWYYPVPKCENFKVTWDNGNTLTSWIIIPLWAWYT